MNIPFKQLDFSSSIPAVKELLKSGFIGLGNTVFEFEQELAKYLGAKYVIATDSCTSALFVSLKFEALQRGILDVVIPSMTVPLVAAAVIESGHRLLFNDNTGWVGNAYRLKGTNVYDSAHELRRDQCVGMAPVDKYCFSFYPTKPIGSADGGAIATDDPIFAKWARSIISYGRNQEQKYQNSWEYEVDLIGYKRHYTNLQAAICLDQLRYLDVTNNRRQKIINNFNAAFDLNNNSLYLYRINVSNRDKFIRVMREKGIECGVHFKPLHMFKAYSNIPFTQESDHIKIEDAYETTVSLPLFEGLTMAEQEYIIQNVKQYFHAGQY